MKKTKCLFGKKLWSWFLIFVFAVKAVPAMEIAAPELLLNDSVVGMTCSYYSLFGHLPWEREKGDWRDSTGQLFGIKPYASAVINRKKQSQEVVFDITDLVQAWHQGKIKNQGLLLKTARSGNSGIVAFYSKEYRDQRLHPMLSLELSDGTQLSLSAVADSSMSCSTVKSQGALEHLKVGADSNSWLRFELNKIQKPVRRALLKMWSGKQYGAGATVDIFQIEPAHLRQISTQQFGIAANYPLDKGISQHPAVIFSHGFESLFWLKDWSDYSLKSYANRINADATELKFSPFANAALKVELPMGKNLGLDLRYNFADDLGVEPEEVYFRYYLRFADNWNPSKDGGKLPGIAGTYGKAGWGMRKSDGFNGWSARGGFDQRPVKVPQFSQLTAISSYGYHSEMTAPSGDGWSWNRGTRALLENNRWYSIEQYVKLNSPGKNDGVIKAWVDGYLVLEKSDINFRKTSDLKIETIWLDVYHGGIAPSPADMTLFIDNVVIASQYIGPAQP